MQKQLFSHGRRMVYLVSLGFFQPYFPWLFFPDKILLSYCFNEEQRFLILHCEKLLQY